jgi:hypothetical protein
LEASSERLASGGDHLCTSGGDHLYTSGLPAVATTSACAPCRGGPRPPSSYRGDDKTIQARDRHLHGVRRLVRPPGGVGAAWPAVAGDAGGAAGAADLRTARPSPVQWTGSHAPLGSRRQRWRRHRSHQSQRDGAAARLASHPKELGARGMDPWLSPLSTFTRLVIILPPRC